MSNKILASLFSPLPSSPSLAKTLKKRYNYDYMLPLSKDKKLMPYQALLFASLALYLYKTSKRNKELGQNDQTRISIDTDGLSKSVTPWLSANPMHQAKIQKVLKEGIDLMLKGLKK